MSSEWQKTLIRYCCDINSSNIKANGPSQYIKYIDISSIGEGCQKEAFKSILRVEAPSRAQRLIASGDCIISTVRPNRRSMIWIKNAVDNLVASTGFAVLRAKTSVILPRFLYYNLFSQSFTDYLVTREKGAAYPAVSTTDIVDAEIYLPPLPEQQTIIDLLGSLDDRIALLRETNATLESIAQAIFKSWFIDFDPVKAKQAGREPEGMDAATAALFPDSFEESELGLIPKGWEVSPLDEIAVFLNGLALQKYPPNGDDDLPVIKIAQLRKGDSLGADRASREIKPEYIVRDGDVLFSWSGSLEVAIWCGGDGALNQHLFKVTSVEFPKWFYYFWTKQHLSDFQRIAASKATTMGHIQRHHLSNAKVVVPPSKVLLGIDGFMSPLLNMWITNSLRVKSLTLTRDTLLPRLISGKLRLPEAEEILKEATA
ncbi:restriction endonuclease subunit S [Chlorobium phaeovibrioides]|uniref:Restriction endonuclease subunit S n=1 Tax=Chlorobium phaeovibrioides TaxID=1094 RepID=A0A3S0U2E3_CHLPH|nr:restriction endonuclease subunit S [Chlorobium phaeovibrioides]RTY39595.1 restriction endonuclease subunit S [Chlorobium phaeovibrioides]